MELCSLARAYPEEARRALQNKIHERAPPAGAFGASMESYISGETLLLSHLDMFQQKKEENDNSGILECNYIYTQEKTGLGKCHVYLVSAQYLRSVSHATAQRVVIKEPDRILARRADIDESNIRC